MRAAVRASIAGAAAAACLAFASPAAQAFVESVQAFDDPQTTYTIDGNTLTIQSSDPIVLEFVRGSELQAACYPVRTPHLRRPPLFVRWGEHASSITFHYAQAIPSPGDCTLTWASGGAHPLPYPTEFSVAPFTAYWRTHLGWLLTPGPFHAFALLNEESQLLRSILPPPFLNQYGVPTSFPAARTVAQIVDEHLHRRGLALVYTRGLAGVKLADVPYVIGRGSTAKRLELAVIGLDGRRYVMHAVPNGPPKFGGG